MRELKVDGEPSHTHVQTDGQVENAMPPPPMGWMTEA